MSWSTGPLAGPLPAVSGTGLPQGLGRHRLRVLPFGWIRAGAASGRSGWRVPSPRSWSWPGPGGTGRRCSPCRPRPPPPRLADRARIARGGPAPALVGGPGRCVGSRRWSSPWSAGCTIPDSSRSRRAPGWPMRSPRPADCCPVPMRRRSTSRPLVTDGQQIAVGSSRARRATPAGSGLQRADRGRAGEPQHRDGGRPRRSARHRAGPRPADRRLPRAAGPVHLRRPARRRARHRAGHCSPSCARGSSCEHAGRTRSRPDPPDPVDLARTCGWFPTAAAVWLGTLLAPLLTARWSAGAGWRRSARRRSLSPCASAGRRGCPARGARPVRGARGHSGNGRGARLGAGVLPAGGRRGRRADRGGDAHARRPTRRRCPARGPR